MLDLTDELAVQAARIFVGAGADVVRVDPGAEAGLAAQVHWHAGKRLSSGAAALGRLAADADVILESGPRAGLRGIRDDGSSRWPDAVHVVVTPFGLSGPHAQWTGDDLVLASAGGMTWLGGRAEGAPQPPPREQATQLAGTHAAIAALLGVLARDRLGAGQLIDISVQEAVAATLETGAITWIHAGHYPVRSGGVYAHVAHRIFAAADGYVAGGYSGSNRMWTDLLAWLAEEGEAADLLDERWADQVVRWRERAHVDEVVARFVAKRTAAEIAEQGRARSLPWAEVAAPERLTDNPQLSAREYFVPVTGPGVPDGLRATGFPWRSPARPSGLTRMTESSSDWLRPARRPSGDRRASGDPRAATDREVMDQRVAAERREVADRRAVGPGALAGVRVLDLTWVLAGPYATKILSEHGADVVKIESAHRQDPTRFAPSMRLRPGAGPDDSGYFLNFNRNKRSVALNLRNPQGQQLLRDLAPHFEVVVENFSPGVLARWGMDYDSLRRLNPDIILVSMAGVGQAGPWREAVTFADTLAAMSGLSSETADSAGPQGLTFGLGDMVAANAAVLAVLELLVRGHGGYADLSQLEAMVSAMGPAVLESQLGESRVPRHVPRGVYPAAGVDRWVAITAGDERQWSALRDLAGLPGGDLDDRRRRSAEIDTGLAAWTRGHSAAELAARLQAEGVAAAVVATGQDLVEHDEHLAARGFYPVLRHPLAGSVQHEGIVARLPLTPGALTDPAPLLGQHTAEVLRELLHLDDKQLAALAAAGVTE